MTSQSMKKKLDWIGIIAIIVMLVGCCLLIQEKKYCEDPFGNILIPYLEEKNITSYSLVVISVYENHGDPIPIERIELFSKPKPYFPNVNINLSE